LVLALVVLWRLWPAFGLVFVWDDAYPLQRDGSWIFTATLRSMAFGRHLSHEERFFSHFLPAALCLLMLAFGAIALTGLVGMLPSEMRIAALAIYAVLVLPLACLAIANRTLRALLCERHQPRRRTDASPTAIDAPRPVLTEQERLAGTAEQGAALLASTRDGDIERALALLEVGADPATAPAADDRDQRPVLMLAALLPDAAAPIDALNQAGLSPLAIACRAPNWPLAKFLLERGAKACPPGGEPALVAAAAIADDDPSGVRLLLKHRAAVN